MNKKRLQIIVRSDKTFLSENLVCLLERTEIQ